MTPTLRPAVLADIPALREMLVATWHATYDATLGVEKVNEIAATWHSLEKLTTELAETEARPAENLLLVAMRGEKLVGTASAHAVHGGPLELARLYIAPDCQRGGLGALLLNAVFTHFAQARASRLEVEPRNATAIAFYRRYGFEVVGQGKACGGDAAAAVEHLVMEAVLPRLALRPADDRDAQDLFGLLALCFAEYPGCFVDPHDDLPDLVKPGHWPAREKAGHKLGGQFLVLEDDRGRVCACVAVDFPAPEEFASEVVPGSCEANSRKGKLAELHRLYVRPDCRRRGIADRLVREAERLARADGATRIILWSDTRFSGAHRLYERLGYERAGTRPCGDISNTTEFHFSKPL